MKNISIIILLLSLTVSGFWLGRKLALPSPRSLETLRVESCLSLYQNYRKNQNQEELAAGLKKLGLTPRDFQEIIDRFIFYRSRKSSLEHAMKLLNAFRLGYDIEAANVHSISGYASEPFRLDAEILAIFESRPELISQAFEG